MQPVDNKRIAKNTLFLYIRMGISMLISLYTSRAILQILGVEDLGIYNVVGSITSLFSWLSGSLANSTQRYLNFEIGANNKSKLNCIFKQSFWIYVIFAIISLVIVELGGQWFIYHKLVIPADRLDASIWILHATSFTLAITLIGSVYDAVLIARENMKIYAYIGLADVALRLGIVYLLLIFPFDKLKVYAVLLSIVFCINKIITIIYCRRHYSETNIKWYWNKGLVREMGAFIGWNSVGTVVFIVNNQGLDFLLNMFFGPVVNAAKAISNQVRNVVLNFTSNFLTSVRPQIVKSYSANAIDDFINLIFRSSRYLFLISWAIGFCIIIRISDILSYWLEIVPDYTAPFCVWTLIFIMINVICDPISCAFQAIGKQKKYVLYGSIVYILAFPLSYAAYKYGMSPTWSFIILAVIRAVYLVVVSYLLRSFVKFSYRAYLKHVIWPIIAVVAISITVALPIDSLFSHSLAGTILSVISCFATVSIIMFFIGINSSERTFVTTRLIKLFHKK